MNAKKVYGKLVLVHHVELNPESVTDSALVEAPSRRTESMAGTRVISNRV